MFKKLLAAFGLGAKAGTVSRPEPPYAPYGDDGSNSLYNLLFCDDAGAFESKRGEPPVPWQEALFSEPSDPEALRALASDASQEGRVRYLAFTKLRQCSESAPPRILLGVIVEVPLNGGLDALAAYSDGGVRYINHTGKVSVLEGGNNVRPLVEGLFAAAAAAVTRIGPSDEPRRPPPKSGDVRMTFLVSDGFYFGEGPMSALEPEPMAGPIIQRATELLQTVASLTTS